MTFAEALLDDVTSVFLDTDEFGQSVTYKPHNDSARSIAAAVELLQDSFDDETGHRVRRIPIRVTTLDSSSTGISDPQQKATLTWNGEVYDFRYVENRDGGAIVCRFERTEVTDSGGRMRRGNL